jgi:hypothetical protein
LTIASLGVGGWSAYSAYKQQKYGLAAFYVVTALGVSLLSVLSLRTVKAPQPGSPSGTSTPQTVPVPTFNPDATQPIAYEIPPDTLIPVKGSPGEFIRYGDIPKGEIMNWPWPQYEPNPLKGGDAGDYLQMQLFGGRRRDKHKQEGNHEFRRDKRPSSSLQAI